MDVSLVSYKDRKKNIAQALTLIRKDIERISRANRIVIKPNLTATKPSCANTHPDAIRAVVEYLTTEFGTKDFVVAEGSGGAYWHHSSTEKVLSSCGFYDLEKECNTLHVVDLDAVDHTLTIPVETWSGTDTIHAVDPRKLGDYVISLAVPKTHDCAIATLSIKNMMGLIRPEERVRMHGIPSRDAGRSSYERSVKLIHRNILSLANVLMPHLAILDGFECMEGNGPTRGDPVSLGVAFASCDPVLADSLGATVMGLAPQEVGYLKYCADEGLGSLDLSEVKGGDPHKISVRFRMHGDYEIQKRWASD